MTAGRFPIDPANYHRSPLHGEERAWPETNCYVDLWIEMLHAVSVEPAASLAYTVAMDFEFDQWTFFKPPLADLHALYGVDVQELTIWRGVLDHVAEQIQNGRVVLLEVDAFFLPDTVGIGYHTEHTKTTIACASIQPDSRALAYFHNAGYFALHGDDFDGIFRLASQEHDSRSLDPYAELVKLDTLEHVSERELAQRAGALLETHLSRRPRSNPIERFRRTFPDDLARISALSMEVFHRYAFANLRQLGASSELAATFVRWLGRHSDSAARLTPAADAFDNLASSAKVLQFKAARAVSTQRPAAVEPLLDSMQSSWESAIECLESRCCA